MNVPSLLNDPVSPVWPLSSSPNGSELERSIVPKLSKTSPFENKRVGVRTASS